MTSSHRHKALSTRADDSPSQQVCWPLAWTCRCGIVGTSDATDKWRPFPGTSLATQWKTDHLMSHEFYNSQLRDDLRKAIHGKPRQQQTVESWCKTVDSVSWQAIFHLHVERYDYYKKNSLQVSKVLQFQPKKLMFSLDCFNTNCVLQNHKRAQRSRDTEENYKFIVDQLFFLLSVSQLVTILIQTWV